MKIAKPPEAARIQPVRAAFCFAMSRVTTFASTSRFSPVLALCCALWLVGQPRTFAAERPAPGHYRTAVRDGAWWFVGPDGRQILSFGVNCVQVGPEAANYDPGKPQYAPLLVHANRDAWAKAALDRLCEWGFNTVGGWSDDAVIAQRRLPYTSVIHLGNRLGAPWFDVFAEDYEAKFDALVAEFVVPHRDDPYLLGWFIDNELGWSTGA
jgi:agarase